MKTILTLVTIALGIAFGSAAYATNASDCKANKGGGYTCDPGGSKTYTYNTATSAAQAAAMLNAHLNNQQAQGQGQQQGQSLDNENVNNNSSTISIDNSTPKVQLGANFGANVNWTIGAGVVNQNANRTASGYAAIGRLDKAEAVLDSTYWGKKANKLLGEAGEPLCQMTKDGVLQVNKYTNVAQCKAFHGIK